MRFRRRFRFAAAAVVALFGLVAVSLFIPIAAGQAAPPEAVAGYSFDDGTAQGWFARGAATVAASPDAARSGTHGLRTTGRADTWQGPGVQLADRLVTRATYTVEAYVRLGAGEADTPVFLTMQRTPAGGTTAFDRIASGSATAGGWTRLFGEYVVPSESTELQLYVESESATAAYDLDDVTVTLTANPPEGPPDEAPISGDFESGSLQGWAPRISSETLTVTTADAHSGQASLLTTNRTQPYAGPTLNLLGRTTKGKKYAFTAWVKLAPGEAPADLRLSLERRTAGTPSYQTLASAPGVTDAAWVRLTATYTLAVDVDFFAVYVETASGTASFYLDDFTREYIRPKPIQTDIPSLRDVFADDFRIGTAISPSDTVGVASELAVKHFNSVTPGNAMKWDATEPAEGEFRFTDADQVASFAASNGLALRGHTLIWHSQTPAWVFQDASGRELTNSPADKALLLARVENHVRAVAGRYAGQIYAWDVANEVIDESQPDGLRRSRWYEIAGDDYLRTAFRVAREVAPGAKLYINDYGTEAPRKRQALYSVVARLRAAGVPIDGVGHQLHINSDRQSVAEVEATFRLFASLGVEQQVTELDISAYTNFVESSPAVSAETLAEQGYRYRDLFDLFRRYRSALTTVTIWGMSDGGTWLRSFPFPRLDWPLLFDEDLQAKPAYWGVVDPAHLPALDLRMSVPKGSPVVDGRPELEWDLLPGASVYSPGVVSGTFKLRWDSRWLYVLADVRDPVRNASDALEVVVDGTPYRIGRSGTCTSGVRARTSSLASGYRVEAAIPLASTGAVDRVLPFDIRFRDGAGSGVVADGNWSSVQLANPVARTDASRATPVVDGVAEPAWARAPRVATGVQVSGNGGATATARLLWDSDHLYVLAEVTDPVLDESSPNTYEQDSIEIFLDPDNTKDSGYIDDDGQYRISFTNHQTITGNRFTQPLIADNLVSATRTTPTGYIVEASIAFETPKPRNSLLGFDLQVNDATAGTRTAARTWYDGTGRSFVDTSHWGVLQLK
ncbi:endo-1,4-beta-xylanase [Flindersiella endophytica]